MEIHNKRELQNIVTNHSADNVYKDFLKIYRNWTKELYSFLTSFTWKEIFRFSFIKITLTEQVKILDDKIKANKAHYDYDREAAKYLHYQVVN